jgi:hypothetical protein
VRYNVAAFSLFFTLVANCQITKQQVGYSTWKYQNRVIADSALTYIMTFDTKGQMRMEHRFLLDSNGKKQDSIYSKIDTFGRYYFYKDNNSKQYTEFDSMGETVLLRLQYTKYQGTKEEEVAKLQRQYINSYNERGKLIASKLTIAGDYEDEQTIAYKNIGNWRIKKEEFITTYTRTNRNGKITYNYCRAKLPGQKKGKSWCYKRRYNLNGDVKYFQDKANGKATKTTRHFYKKGIEYKRVEQFIESNFQVTTFFKTTYY